MLTSNIQSQQLAAVNEEPAIENEKASEQIKNSYAGKLGHFIEPIIQPLGFDWKIGIGLVASFGAREVSNFNIKYHLQRRKRYR